MGASWFLCVFFRQLPWEEVVQHAHQKPLSPRVPGGLEFLPTWVVFPESTFPGSDHASSLYNPRSKGCRGWGALFSVGVNKALIMS